MGRYRNQGTLRTINGIDMTPLMDLTFLLLIVFMITAPVLEYAVDVTPPELNAAPLNDTGQRLINVTRQGRIMYEERDVSRRQLAAVLAALARTRPDAQVLVRADERRPYGEVVAVMRTAQQAGIVNVSLVTAAESEE